MMNKINLLVLPALFPVDSTDHKGIFVLDYIESILPFCNVKVFTINLYGKQKGILKETFNGIEITRLVLSDKKPANPLAKLLLYKRFFSEGIAEAKKICPGVDIIHVHNSALYGNIALGLNKQLGIPYVITEHTGPFSKISKSRINRAYASRAWQKCSKLLLVSNDLAKQVKKSGMKPPQFVITGNPVNTELFSLKETKSEFKTITFAARLEDYKGGFRTVKAFSLIAQRFPDWKLHIMGDGPEFETINFFIEKNNLKKRIFLTGSFNKQLMKEQFHRSSFFVFPSEHETFGLVLAEAMSCGLPVITGNATALPEVADNDAGIKINPASVEELSAAIEKMIGTYHTYNSEQIRSSIVNRFSFPVFGERLNQIYQSVLKS